MLVSATPSVETEVNARRGRYAALHLPERFGGQHLPHRGDRHATEGPPRGRFIAPRLAEAVKIAVERGEQALLFLNRRGYAPLTLCRDCGYRLACPNCDAWLVDHRFRRRLVCHHCGFVDAAARRHARMPARPNCFVAGGPGVERLAGGSRRRCFPTRASRAVERPYRRRSNGCARNSTTSRAARSTSSSARSLWPRAITFPKLNLVGIVDADLGLATAIRAPPSARSRLLHQVVGRAGREDGPGIGLSADPPARASGDDAR